MRVEEMVVGLAGAAAVAIWFLLYDLAEGTPFRTPALLDAAPFHGLRDASALTVTPRLVLEYTVVHGLAFILFGLGAVVPSAPGEGGTAHPRRVSLSADGGGPGERREGESGGPDALMLSLPRSPEV